MKMSAIEIPLRLAILLSLLNATFPAFSAIPDGPGVPKKTYSITQLGKPLSIIKSREGHGSVTMHRGYMVLIYSKDMA